MGDEFVHKYADSWADLLVAPNNGTPWYHNSCVTSALGKGALSAGVDAIGLIPD
jgi:hypothetical protein